MLVQASGVERPFGCPVPYRPKMYTPPSRGPLPTYRYIALILVHLWHGISEAYDCFPPGPNGTQALKTAINDYTGGGTTAKLLYGPVIGNWCVDNVTSFMGVFQGQTTFNEPLTNWRTSSATNMAQMFQNCFTFNQPLGQFDVSRVTSMDRMFLRAYSFSGQGVANWNVSSVQSLYWTFKNCTIFNQPVSNWDVRSVTDLSETFRYTVLNQNLCPWGSKLSSSKVGTRITNTFDGTNCPVTTNINFAASPPGPVCYACTNVPPTAKPTKTPTKKPTTPAPTRKPTVAPIAKPTRAPTRKPTRLPTRLPTKVATAAPTRTPTRKPTAGPTAKPTRGPTRKPTRSPTKSVTAKPTRSPTRTPTKAPTQRPTKSPTKRPTRAPTLTPTRTPLGVVPTRIPTPMPTNPPTPVSRFGTSCFPADGVALRQTRNVRVHASCPCGATAYSHSLKTLFDKDLCDCYSEHVKYSREAEPYAVHSIWIPHRILVRCLEPSAVGISWATTSDFISRFSRCTKNVQSFRSALEGPHYINDPLTYWNTSSATRMDFFFYNAKSFDQDLVCTRN